MTADDLIAEAKHQRSGPMSDDAMSSSNLSEFLRFALGHLLEEIDYEADKAAHGAIAARVIATIITGADELAAKAVH
jgi:hypothetical protein